LLPFGTIVNFWPAFIFRFVILPKIEPAKVTLGHEMRFPLFYRLRSAAKMNMFSFIRNFIGCPSPFVQPVTQSSGIFLFHSQFVILPKSADIQVQALNKMISWRHFLTE
jgi:hypothetical protein